MKKLGSMFILLVWSTIIFAQAKLQSGPMLGYGEMREVMVWLQTQKPAKAKIRYWKKSLPNQSFYSLELKTEAAEACTAHFVLDEVLPGESYAYEVLLEGKPLKFEYPLEFKTQPLWKYRTDPPNFKVAMGSCFFSNEERFDRPGKPYGGDFQIFSNIYARRPDVMLWLGDNVYLREADFNTRKGILERYTHSRSTPEIQPLLASTYHLATWDDHDFGPDDSNRSFAQKDLTMEAFKLFWGNPSYGVNGKGGTTTFYQYGDADFFLLDDRYFRAPDECKTCERTLLGKDQLEWLIEALASSKATFKFVAIGGQVLNTVSVYETYIHFFPEERAFILKRIEEENIKGVIFLTGDRHFSECSRYKNAAGNWVYDLTVSPLTSGPSNPQSEQEGNEYRMAGSFFATRNFATLDFSGKKKERILSITIVDANGNELWNHKIDARDWYGN